MRKSWDPQWEIFFQKTDGNQYPNACVVRFVARHYYNVPRRSDVSILDLGCGSGAVSWFLAREGFNTHGIDASTTAIRKAGERLEREGLHGDLRMGDFVILPHQDNVFDAVIDMTSIQHNAPEAILQVVGEVRRVLKKGGMFFGMMIAVDDKINAPGFKTHFFTKEEIKELFSKFSKLNIDHVVSTEENERKAIKFWLVEARK